MNTMSGTDENLNANDQLDRPPLAYYDTKSKILMYVTFAVGYARRDITGQELAEFLLEIRHRLDDDEAKEIMNTYIEWAATLEDVPGEHEHLMPAANEVFE